MKAVGYLESRAITEPDALIDIELPEPVPVGRDILVAVKAISVNPVDTKIRMRAQGENGHYKVLGWDAVGEVVAVGDAVEHYQVGDRVWYAGDVSRSGSNAQRQLVDERIVGRAPESLSDADAAALPLTAITAWELLFDRLGFVPGLHQEKSVDKRLVIVGAAGGVGSILTQLAAKLTNATVIGTASRSETQEWVTQLGADYVIDHAKPLFEELQRIGIDEVSHVASLTQTQQHFADLVAALAPQGKLALIDDPSEPLDIRLMKQKSLSLHWEFMFTRPMKQTPDMDQQRQLLNEVARLIDAGEIVSTCAGSMGNINAANLIKAHAQLESGSTKGKLVLAGWD